MQSRESSIDKTVLSYSLNLTLKPSRVSFEVSQDDGASTLKYGETVSHALGLEMLRKQFAYLSRLLEDPTIVQQSNTKLETLLESYWPPTQS